jgi:hypothetical protein
LHWLKQASLTVECAFVLPMFFLGILTMVSFMDLYKLQTEKLVTLCENVKTVGTARYMIGSEQGQFSRNIGYTYEPLAALVPLGKVKGSIKVSAYAWVGRTYSEEEAAKYEEQDEEMVYVAETGSVYHKDIGCSYLNLSINQVAGTSVAGMTNASGKHYSACETCSRGGQPAGVVYVTSNGTRYHNLETCSGLKRTVRLVKLSKVNGMSACSRCGAT